MKEEALMASFNAEQLAQLGGCVTLDLPRP